MLIDYKMQSYINIRNSKQSDGFIDAIQDNTEDAKYCQVRAKCNRDFCLMDKSKQVTHMYCKSQRQQSITREHLITTIQCIQNMDCVQNKHEKCLRNIELEKKIQRFVFKQILDFLKKNHITKMLCFQATLIM